MAQVLQLTLFIVAALGCFVMGPVSGAFNHIVGGSWGWKIPPNATFYQAWAAKPRVFGVGDKLIFPYTSGHHNVIQVENKDGFNNCSMDHTVTMIAKGPTIFSLDKPGEYFFFCGVGKHCEQGEKLQITVTNEKGTSGTQFSFDFSFAANSSSVPAPVPRANAPEISSATSICDVGVVSGLVTFLLLLFI